MSFLRNARRAGVLGLSMLATAAYADGSGTLGDDALTFEYTSGVFVVPNMTPFAGDPVPVLCEPGTPTCDVYTLTIEISDEFRETNDSAIVDIFMSWGGTPVDVGGVITVPDFDFYLFDGSGNNMSSNAGVTAANPELISLPLELMPNGTYTLQVIPFFPMGQAFTLTGEVTGLEEEGKSGGIAGAGALGATLLLPLALLGFVRRRAK